MNRRRLSQILATLLGAVAPCMALDFWRCDGSAFKGEVTPIKVEANAVKVNVNLGGSNSSPAEPPPHVQSGAPPGSYGTPIKCVARDDGRFDCGVE